MHICKLDQHTQHLLFFPHLQLYKQQISFFLSLFLFASLPLSLSFSSSCRLSLHIITLHFSTRKELFTSSVSLTCFLFFRISFSFFLTINQNITRFSSSSSSSPQLSFTHIKKIVPIRNIQTDNYNRNNNKKKTEPR